MIHNGEHDTDVLERGEARALAVKGGAAIAGAAIGSRFGPMGMAIGAVTPALLELFALQEHRDGEELMRLLDLTIEQSGMSENEFLAWAGDSDGRLFLVTSAMHAAFTTATEQKIAALARVVTENLDDDGTLTTGRS